MSQLQNSLPPQNRPFGGLCLRRPVRFAHLLRIPKVPRTFSMFPQPTFSSMSSPRRPVRFRSPAQHCEGPPDLLVSSQPPKSPIFRWQAVLQLAQIRELHVHPLRPRRAKKGELIQLDGPEHDWFEGRGPRCTLLVFIDDATSETMHLKFVKSENIFDYFG